MAIASHNISSTILPISSLQKPSFPPQSLPFLKLPTITTAAAATTSRINLLTPPNAIPSTSSTSPTSSSFTTNTSPVSSSTTTTTNFYGLCYVVRDDVETDQIIPTEYSTLNPSNPEEYKQLGSYTLSGLPSNSYALRFVEENGVKSKYSIIIAGNNFGSGVSGEHANAVVALDAAGIRAVVAESYDGVFLKIMNSNLSEKILGLETEVRICEQFKTGDVATIDVEERILVNRTTGKVYQLKGIVDADQTLVS